MHSAPPAAAPAADPFGVPTSPLDAIEAVPLGEWLAGWDEETGREGQDLARAAAAGVSMGAAAAGLAALACYSGVNHQAFEVGLVAASMALFELLPGLASWRPRTLPGAGAGC